MIQIFEVLRVLHDADYHFPVIVLTASLNYCVPAYHESSLTDILGHQQAQAALMARANFYIDELRIESNILLFFELESFRSLAESVNRELIA